MIRPASDLPLFDPVRAVRPKRDPRNPAMIHHVVGLFAGIGGIERGLARHGHDAVLLCENDPAASTVLARRFPEVPIVGDVRLLSRLPGETTLVAAGFPCQDLSQAGKTAGIAGSRSGLVGEVFRLLRDREAPWLLLENVPFMLQLAGGRAMDVIADALEDMGYAWAYRVVDARAFGVPQRRRRVYLVASKFGDPREVLFADEAHEPAPASDPNRRLARGFYWTEGLRGLGWAIDAVPTLKGGSTIGIPSPPAILLPDGRVVQPDIRDAERLQGFPANWTVDARTHGRPGVRWKLVGNAVCVPAAAWIGRRMAKPGALLDFATEPLRRTAAWPEAAWNVGEGRVRVHASEWPVMREGRNLATFLRYPGRELSARATAGFLSRARKGSLQFEAGFLDALECHLDRVASASA